MTTEKPLILVVDDESDALSYLYDLLHNEGYRVLPISHPFDAIACTREKSPALIITDVRMPELDGIELLERVKQIAPQTRVVLLTAYGDWSMYEDVLRKGCDGMLLKPVSNREILRTVHQALEGVKAC
jgi:CheY-like chemotaxis protein